MHLFGAELSQQRYWWGPYSFLDVEGVVAKTQRYTVTTTTTATDHQDDSGEERATARRSSVKGRERAIVNQTNIGTVSNATLGKLLRDGVECIIMGFSEHNR